MGRLAGKVAYVLGAAGRGNMGQVIAQRFAEEGATVAVGGRHAEELEWLAGEIGGMAVTCDITKMEDIKSSIGAIMDAHGKIDIAVNATGLGLLAQFEETTEEELNMMMDLQFKGPYQWMQEGPAYEPVCEESDECKASASIPLKGGGWPKDGVCRWGCGVNPAGNFLWGGCVNAK